jgi:hydrogenase expression/formation protein HypC
MKIVHIEGTEALVASGGLERKIGLHLVKNVGIGDYVIVHAGFAIEKLDEENARETLELLKQIGRPQ